jgi:hypothetical protein
MRQLSRRSVTLAAVAAIPAVGISDGWPTKAQFGLPDVEAEDSLLRRQLRTLLARLRTDSNATVAVHYDRQMIANELQAIVGDGGELWQPPDDMKVTMTKWGFPQFRFRDL